MEAHLEREDLNCSNATTFVTSKGYGHSLTIVITSECQNFFHFKAMKPTGVGLGGMSIYYAKGRTSLGLSPLQLPIIKKTKSMNTT